MDNLKGNITTIITWISLLILPYVATYGITHEQLTSLISAIIGIIWAIYNSKHPNTFKCLGNNEQTIQVEVTTDDLQQAIQKAKENLEEKEETINTIQETEEVVGDDQQ